MTKVRAIAVGSLVVAVLLVATLLGLGVFFTGSTGNGPPIWETAVWDGDQFVLNDNFLSVGDDGAHWTSPDGIEWTKQSGLVVEAGQFFCHPPFPCDLVPDEVPQVPLMFAKPQTVLMSGRGDVALAGVSVRYDLVEDLPEGEDQPPGMPVRIHRSVLAMAAADSECFEEIYEGGSGYRPGPGDPELTAYGGGHEGNEWIFSATCLDDGVEARFSLDLADHLSPAELRLFEGGTSPELWVVGTDGSRRRVENPPTRIYSDDIPGSDVTWTAVADIVTSGSRFWAVADEGLVVSTDGFDWLPFEVDTDGWMIERIVANPGGDVGLVLTDNTEFSDVGEKLVMVSHDDGESWSDIIPLTTEGGSVWVANVGPAGVAVTRSEPRSEIEQFIDDSTGEVVFSAVSSTGSDRMTVGRDTVLMPRERIAASGEYLGPVLDVYDINGAFITTVFPD